MSGGAVAEFLVFGGRWQHGRGWRTLVLMLAHVGQVAKFGMVRASFREMGRMGGHAGWFPVSAHVWWCGGGVSCFWRSLAAWTRVADAGVDVGACGPSCEVWHGAREFSRDGTNGRPRGLVPRECTCLVVRWRSFLFLAVVGSMDEGGVPYSSCLRLWAKLRSLAWCARVFA